MTPEQPKPDKQRKSAEALILHNGHLIEDLFKSPAWVEIVLPLLQESIAGVSGRYTNGRFWHGRLTTDWDDNNSLFLAAYQKALMEFHNNVHDFVVAKNQLLDSKRLANEEATGKLINPFLEDQDD